MEHRLDKFFRHIDSFDISHYVWIHENKNRPILQSVHSLKKVGDIREHHKKIARVLAVAKAQGTRYYYLEIDGEEIGWCDLKTSIIVYSKPREHVRLDLDKFIQHQDVQIFAVSKNNLRLLKDQMLDSRFVMVRNGVHYEALFKKHKLQGWFSSDTLVRSEKADIKVTDIKEGFQLFEFNNLTSEVKLNENKLFPITIVHMFRDIGLAKVRTGQGNYWADMKYMVYDESSLPPYEPPYTFDETVVYDLIQNISEERTMTRNLVERLKSQFKDTDIDVEPPNKEEFDDMAADKEYEEVKQALQDQKEKYKQLENRYKNLRNSPLGKLQTKYWQMRK